MPPKGKPLRAAKKGRAGSNVARTSANGSSSVNDSVKPVCDGCSGEATTTDSLQCRVCNTWLHRYCAGVPCKHYSSLMSTFTCLVCSQAENLRVQADLRQEISSLSSELVELRAAFEVLQERHNSLAFEQSQDLQCSYSGAVKSKLPAAAPSTQRSIDTSNRRQANFRSQQRGGPATAHPQHRRHRKQPSTAGRVPVDGARRVWGAFSHCTPTAIQNAIAKLTSIKGKLNVKRKTKVSTNNKSVWWFVIHGQESILCTLDAEWEKVRFQTNWSLEQCFMSSENDAANPNEASSPTLTQSNDPSDHTPSRNTHCKNGRVNFTPKLE